MTLTYIALYFLFGFLTAGMLFREEVANEDPRAGLFICSWGVLWAPLLLAGVGILLARWTDRQ